MFDIKNFFHFLVRFWDRSTPSPYPREIAVNYTYYELQTLTPKQTDIFKGYSTLKNTKSKRLHFLTTQNNTNSPEVLLWNFGKWKRCAITFYLSEYKTIFAHKTNDSKAYYENKSTLNFQTHIVWGKSESKQLNELFIQENITPARIEDGFIRSTNFGSQFAQPLSIVFDKKGIYFDSGCPSDLENLLNDYKSETSPQLERQIIALLKLFTDLKITKYNGSDISSDQLISSSKKRKVLVLGQVEDDASIRFGAAAEWNNDKLLEFAARKNPDSEIIYKPHPEVVKNYRKGKLTQLGSKYTVINQQILLADLFKEVEHVYTITSLSGFEALLHGVSVTTLGIPFYSGWGPTNDQQKSSRRNNKLTEKDLFYCCYILYPRYILNLDDQVTGFIATILRVAGERRASTVKHLTIKECQSRLNHVLRSNYWGMVFRPTYQNSFSYENLITIKEALSKRFNANSTQSNFYQKILGNLIASIGIRKSNETNYQNTDLVYEILLNSSKGIAPSAQRLEQIETTLLLHIKTENLIFETLPLLSLVSLQKNDFSSALMILELHNTVFPFQSDGLGHLLQARLNLSFGNTSQALLDFSIACMMCERHLSVFDRYSEEFEGAISSRTYRNAMKSAWPAKNVAKPVNDFNEDLLTAFISLIDKRYS